MKAHSYRLEATSACKHVSKQGAATAASSPVLHREVTREVLLLTHPCQHPQTERDTFLPRLLLGLTGQVSRAHTAQALSFFSSILSLHSPEPRRRAGSRAVPAGRAVPGALPSATMKGGRPAAGSRSPASAWLRAA